MKKTMTTLVTLVAVIALTASFAAVGPHCGGKAKDSEATEHAQAKLAGHMGECCLAAAKASEGCCGHSAEQIQAGFAAYKVAKAVKADMHDCCAKALVKSKGCCGQEAEAMRADFNTKVAERLKAKDKDAVKAAVTGMCDPAACDKTACAAHAKAGCGAKAKAKAGCSGKSAAKEMTKKADSSL